MGFGVGGRVIIFTFVRGITCALFFFVYTLSVGVARFMLRKESHA